MDSFPANRLAEHLRSLRVAKGFSLQALSDAGTVSRATLSRIENGEVSPTAETLGRLAVALGLPISRLLAPLEAGFEPLKRIEAQAVWRDATSGFTRRSVSPPGGDLTVELIACTIEPHRRIAYDRAAIDGQEHHLLLLDGALTVTVEGTAHPLQPGDCLRYRLRGPSIFETGDAPARYVIALA